MEMLEKIISNLKIVQCRCVEHREKRLEKKIDLQGSKDNIKCLTDMNKIQEGEVREYKAHNLFGETMPQNFSNLMKDINFQNQEAQ